MEENQQIIERQKKDNLENGEEYVGLTKPPYQNLMLDKWILKTKERLIGHKSFLPQDVVWHEVWIGGFQKRHNYKQQSPWREMESNIHPNEWV